ncbi:MAG TPA: hypothetical protein H9717_06160 [Candidatus Eisenbergiella merdipullorum]|uniref:Uncharacterized protein n=1 Tax=Candidatus Eisenbergiella merdipullorum TaxID=2838553 RepID=A0A9D2L0S1_9FIRM|nr:hypothetical protein [Candidatus Eisenbergiella merdipullorum]
MKKKYVLLFGMILTVFIAACGNQRNMQSGEDGSLQSAETKPETETVAAQEKETIEVSVVIEDHYITNMGDPSNLYHIDENNVLWGCGRNNYGQLGQGTQDYDFHEEMVKIAEDVIHVDYSQEGFVIYLTADHDLYGFGNAGTGALRQLDEFSVEFYNNGEACVVKEPVLLMPDVTYARCGREDVVCLRSDQSVWTWGTIWYENGGYDFRGTPEKILDETVWVTGGPYNHAALLRDGSVWTWGYNYSGNCGIKDMPLISDPQEAANGVEMVWTGRMEENVNCEKIADFDGIYERQMENTVIRRTDGTYWICGANVGNEEKVLPVSYEVTDYVMTCTSEFLPYEGSDYGNMADEDQQISNMLICRNNDVFSFDRSSLDITGLYKNIENLLWIAPRGGAGIDTEGSKVEAASNRFIMLSENMASGDIPEENVLLIRLTRERAVEAGAMPMSYKDILLYRENEDAYLAWQMADDLNSWYLYQLPGYGDWMEKEVAIFLRCAAGF